MLTIIPYTRAPRMAECADMALKSFQLVAPGIKPSQQDMSQLSKLTGDLFQNLSLPATITRTRSDDDQWLVEIGDAHDQLWSVWVENASTPNAFVYWEA